MYVQRRGGGRVTHTRHLISSLHTPVSNHSALRTPFCSYFQLLLTISLLSVIYNQERVAGSLVNEVLDQDNRRGIIDWLLFRGHTPNPAGLKKKARAGRGKRQAATSASGGMSRPLATRWALIALLLITSSQATCVVEGVASPLVQHHHHG